MIKHIVMWKLHETAEGNSKAQNAQLAKAKLEAGIDFSSSAISMDLILYSEFEELARRQQHPQHVVDYEV